MNTGNSGTPNSTEATTTGPSFKPAKWKPRIGCFIPPRCLFATIAALGGCAAYLGFRRLSKSERAKGLFFTPTDCRRQALALRGILGGRPFGALANQDSAGNPRERRLDPARGFLGTVLGGIDAAVDGQRIIAAAGFSRGRSSGPPPRTVMSRLPKRSEIAFWNLLLFPLYPLLRYLCPRRCPVGRADGRVDAPHRPRHCRADLGFSKSRSTL